MSSVKANVEIQSETNIMNMSVCGLDLTLPFDFVREWIDSTTKQYWTANTKDCILTNQHVCMEEDAHTTCSGKSTRNGEKSLVIETDMTEMYGQRTYLHASISGIQICLKKGRLQLSFIDIMALDTNDRHSCLEHSLSNKTDTAHSNKAVVDTGVSLEKGDCGDALCSVPFELAENKQEEYADSLKFTEPAEDDHPQGKQTLFGSNITKQAESSGKENSDNLQPGHAMKRKRGRPKKITNTLPPAESSFTSKLNKPPASAKLQHVRTSGYSLRGKKLPLSLFGDSGSEPEEQLEDDEYHPPKGTLPQLESSIHRPGTNTESVDVVKDQNFSESNVERARHGVDKHDNGNQLNYLETRDENESQTCFVKTENSHELSEEELQENSVRKNCKRLFHLGRPRSSYANGAVVKPVKGKRMKIDVTGLPTYSRRKRNNEKKAACRFCGRKFCDFTGVLMHAKKFHADVKGLDKYLIEVKRLSAVKCSTCFKEFANRFQLQMHEDKVHFKTGELPCGQCGKMFSNMVLVKQHIRSVHQVKGQRHACSLCPARFKWAATLKTHVAEVHHGIRDIQCQTCGKKFHRQAQLNRHATIHGPDHQKLPCPICGRRFSYTNNLQRHLAIIHPPPQNGPLEGEAQAWHHCPYCEKGFKRKESLHNHVGKLHFSLYPHHCRLCQAGFQRGTLLEKHMATEHGDSDFRAPSGRRIHFKYNRGEGDELACGLCRGKFFYKTQLVEHVLTDHSDTFPYHCELCPRQLFMERSFYVMHRKRAHGIQSELEDAEFILDDSSASRGQYQTFTVLEGLDGSHVLLHRKSLSQSLTRKKLKGSAEEGSPLGDRIESSFPSNSFVIKVENGTKTIQYVIQNPEGDNSEPSEMIVQDIANFLLAANNPSLQEGELTCPSIILDSAIGQEKGSPSVVPEAPNIVISHPVGNEDEENGDPNCVLMEAEGDSTLQDMDVPAEILIGHGHVSGVQEAVASTAEMEVDSSSGKPSASEPQESEENQMTSQSLLASAGGNMPERIIVTGSDVVRKFTADSGLVSEQVMSSVSGADDRTVCLMNSDDVGNDSNPLNYVTMETVPSMSVSEADLELETVYSYPEVNSVTVESSADATLESAHSQSNKVEATHSYIAMDTVHNLQYHNMALKRTNPHVAVEMVSSHSGISLDSTQPDLAIQPVSVHELPENIILGASEVFSPCGGRQQIIITMTATNEQNEEGLPASIEQSD